MAEEEMKTSMGFVRAYEYGECTKKNFPIQREMSVSETAFQWPNHQLFGENRSKFSDMATQSLANSLFLLIFECNLND